MEIRDLVDVKDLIINGVIIHNKVIERITNYKYSDGLWFFFDKNGNAIILATGQISILTKEGEK